MLYFTAVRKMEYSLYKLYLVVAAQSTGGVRNEKVAEFLAKMLPELQGQNEWRDWFSKYCYCLHFTQSFVSFPNNSIVSWYMIYLFLLNFLGQPTIQNTYCKGTLKTT